MKIFDFPLTISVPTQWYPDYHYGATFLAVNGEDKIDCEIFIAVGDRLVVATACNALSGVVQAVAVDGDRLVVAMRATYDGAFNGAGVGSDWCGIVWESDPPADARIATSLGGGVRTWGGYTRFRRELRDASESAGAKCSPHTVGNPGSVSLNTAQRKLRDFQANRGMMLSTSDSAMLY